jgi:hypothetical protein
MATAPPGDATRKHTIGDEIVQLRAVPHILLIRAALETRITLQFQLEEFS